MSRRVCIGVGCDNRVPFWRHITCSRRCADQVRRLLGLDVGPIGALARTRRRIK